MGTVGVTNTLFAGNNQDTTTNLYDAQFREYGIQGRWASPDPAGVAAANPANPQSWNRYAYVMNNPLAFIDPFGLDPIAVGPCIKGEPSKKDKQGNVIASCECVGDGNCFWVPATGTTVTATNGNPLIPIPTTPPAESLDVPTITGGPGGGPGGCGSTAPPSISSLNVTTNAPTIPAGALIGGAIAGPPGALVGGIIGSFFGVGLNASYVSSTNTLYGGPTIVFAPALGGGNGFSFSAVNVPSSQNPNSIASGLSFSATFQPKLFAGATVVKTPGSGPPVVGFSTGSRVPAAFGMGYNFTLAKGCR